MGSMFVYFTKNIEKERFNIKVKSFVIKEQFCQKAEILAICLVMAAVSFPDTKSALAIDLLAWWLSPRALALQTNGKSVD